MDNYLAIDTETTGVLWSDTPFCISLVERYDNQYTDSVLDLRKEGNITLAKNIIEQHNHLIFFNAKFDIQMLQKVGVNCAHAKEIDDVYIMAHLLNENRQNNLKALAEYYIGYKDEIEVEIKTGKNKGQYKKVSKESYELGQARKKLNLTKKDGYDKLPWDIIKPYALLDAVWTSSLYQIFSEKIIQEDLEYSYQKEIQLIKVLLEVEEKGVGVDLDKLNMFIQKYSQKLYELEYVCKQLAGSEDFNPSSVKQVLSAFKNLGVELKSTDKSSLEKIDSPLAVYILKFRQTEKILSTYLKNIKKEEVGGILHPSFKSMVRTGRMASGTHKGD